MRTFQKIPMPRRTKKVAVRLPRNKFEQKIVDQCTKQGVQFGYEISRIHYVMEKLYIPDITIIRGPNKFRYIEIKGYFDQAAQAKMKAMKKSNPGIDIRFVFTDSSKPIRKGSEMTYADWCDKWGFKHAEIEIPEKWFK